jgi:hypothetical protein
VYWWSCAGRIPKPHGDIRISSAKVTGIGDAAALTSALSLQSDGGDAVLVTNASCSEIETPETAEQSGDREKSKKEQLPQLETGDTYRPTSDGLDVSNDVTRLVSSPARIAVSKSQREKICSERDITVSAS